MSLELQAVIKWAKINGSYIDDKIDFKYTQGKGVSAILNNDLISKNDLIKIPKQILITDIYAKNVFGNQLKVSANSNAALQLLIAKLKFDKCPTIADGNNLSEKFKPYIDFLPKNGKETGCPYFWSMEEKELLKGTDAQIFMNRTFLNVLEEWKILINQLEPTKQIKDELLEYEAFKMGVLGGRAVDYLLNVKEISWTSFTAYLWSHCIFTSRAFPYILFDSTIDDLNKAFLLPVVDLLNHENDRRVKWTVENNNEFVFNTSDEDANLRKDCELFNNYGDKSNLELLLGYGFVVNNNKHDNTTLTLKVISEILESAKTYGVKLPKDASAEGINFNITDKEPLSNDLVNFFAFLVKLSTEKDGFNLRMKLDGLNQLKAIIESKLTFFKNFKIEASDLVSIENSKTIKTYRNSQRLLFQQSLEEAEKLEKKLLLEYKPISFKKSLKADTRFMNSFLLTFGTRSYDDLVKKNLLDHALLLWIIRNANKMEYPEVDDSIFPPFIYDTFQDVKNSIEITEHDISEFTPTYKSLFPTLSQKIPEIYGKGDWSIKNLIIAGTVSDRISFRRLSNNEIFLLTKITLD